MTEERISIHHDPEITAPGMELSQSARRAIDQGVRRLEAFYPSLESCGVRLESHGSADEETVGVLIDMRVPGTDPILVYRRNCPDVDHAIRSGFDLATRILDDFARVEFGR